jgi:lysophospholipase L1-like esterase
LNASRSRRERASALGAVALVLGCQLVADLGPRSERSGDAGESSSGGASGSGSAGKATSSAGNGSGGSAAGKGGRGGSAGSAGNGSGGSAGSSAGGDAGEGGTTSAGGTGGAATSGGGGTGGGDSGGPGTGGNAGSGAGGGNAGQGGGGGAGGAAGGGAGTGGAGGGAGTGGAGGGAGTGGAGGGAGTGSGTGGSGGAPGFDPCPTSGSCRILPLGDSITTGIGFAGAYRVELFRLAVADGKDLTFVGSLTNGPTTVSGVPFPRAHEGHNGWTIAQVDDIVPSPALDVDPHIVLMHIGTNDLSSSAAGAPDRLGTLIDGIVAELPNALLVVSNLIPRSGATDAVATFNAAVPVLVQDRAAAGKHVIFVDQFTGFPTEELTDGFHPNEAGCNFMGARWYAAISSYLH